MFLSADLYETVRRLVADEGGAYVRLPLVLRTPEICNFILLSADKAMGNPFIVTISFYSLFLCNPDSEPFS